MEFELQVKGGLSFLMLQFNSLHLRTGRGGPFTSFVFVYGQNCPAVYGIRVKNSLTAAKRSVAPL